MDIYRVTDDSPLWMKKAYDYARTDAFCLGQNIPIDMEYGHDKEDEPLEAVIVIEDRMPVAGCRITYPEPGIGKIGRVCVVRDRQKSGVGRAMIAEAERWIAENGVDYIVINSQDRAAGFYLKLGYKVNESLDPGMYETYNQVRYDDAGNPLPKPPRPNLGFSNIMVEKYLKSEEK